MDATLLSLAREAILVALAASSPLLVAALAVGLTVGVLQAVTQIQDPAPGVALRLGAIFAALAACAPWMAGLVVRFARTAMSAAFGVIR